MEGDQFPEYDDLALLISIHALRVEGDRIEFPLSVRTLFISIHALRVEGDAGPLHHAARRVDFYPRPPGGGRPRGRCENIIILRFLSTPSGWRATLSCSRANQRLIFLSTPSGWRATAYLHGFAFWRVISIHALRVEGDMSPRKRGVGLKYFYPRPPGGGRLFCFWGKPVES